MSFVKEVFREFGFAFVKPHSGQPTFHHPRNDCESAWYCFRELPIEITKGVGLFDEHYLILTDELGMK